LRRSEEIADAWRQNQHDRPAGWRDASRTSDHIQELSADQLGDLMAEIHATLERAMRTEPFEGHRRVFPYFHALPKVDRVADPPPTPEPEAGPSTTSRSLDDGLASR
jgi:hypothetical protein